MSIGLKIRKYRKSLNMTQQDLADALNVSRVYIQAIESNRRNPSMKLLKRMAPVLNTDFADLMSEAFYNGTPERIQLEKMLDNGEVEIWYRTKKLSKKELKMVYRIISATLDDWDDDNKKNHE